MQNYPSPLPAGRPDPLPADCPRRFADGGCPLFDKDATWANTTVVPTIDQTGQAVSASGLANITYLDLTQAFVGTGSASTASASSGHRELRGGTMAERNCLRQVLRQTCHRSVVTCTSDRRRVPQVSGARARRMPA